MSEIPEWRRRALRHLDLLLVLLELVLSAVFFAVSVANSSPYFRGVGVGLVIAGVTTGVAAVYRRVSGVDR